LILVYLHKDVIDTVDMIHTQMECRIWCNHDQPWFGWCGESETVY